MAKRQRRQPLLKPEIRIEGEHVVFDYVPAMRKAGLLADPLAQLPAGLLGDDEQGPPRHWHFGCTPGHVWRG